MTQWQDGYGVKMTDLVSSAAFSRAGQMLDLVATDQAFDRIRIAVEKSTQDALNELVQIAVDCCHADSAGISLEEEGPDGKLQFRWVAVAASFSPYLNGTTPRFYSPCGTCLDRGVAQRYQVWEPYYSFLGVTAKPIRDGLLIPWRGTAQQGTLWLVSHDSHDAFTASDFALMGKLSSMISESLENL